MKQTCQRCKKSWDYKGSKGQEQYQEFISCPKCRTKVKLIINEDEYEYVKETEAIEGESQ